MSKCAAARSQLPAGDEFQVGHHSVILMSLRHNAPYRDRIEDGGTTLIYERHDQSETGNCPNPKGIDQPEGYPSGTLTENGRFHLAAQEAKRNLPSPERVRLYEQAHSGIWSYNGMIHLVDSWTEYDKYRSVFKFRLEAVEGDEDSEIVLKAPVPRRRINPNFGKACCMEA